MEEEKRIKEIISEYTNTHNPKSDVIIKQLRDMDHLAKNYIEQNRFIEAVEEYEMIKNIIREYFSCDIEQYYYWLTLVSLSEGRAYWAAKNEEVAEKLFLEAKDYCEVLEEETGKVDLILRDKMLYLLAAFYSFNSKTYRHSEELMIEVRDIRKMLWEMSTNKSKERLTKLIEIYFPLIDLATWQERNPEEYIREKEKYQKILERMDDKTNGEST